MHPDGEVRVGDDELMFPNGIVLGSDASTLLVAESTGYRAVRVAPGGEVLQTIPTKGLCLSVALGGADGRTLYLCTTEVTDPDEAPHAKSSHIEQIRVEIPGTNSSGETQ